MSPRTAMLTGVTGGWGRAVLDRFLDRGWNVCVTHSRRRDGDLPAGVLAVEADLTDPASAEARGRGRARALRHGRRARPAWPADSGCPGPLHEAPPDDWHGQLAVNLETAYTMTRAALRPMLEAGSGSIVYVGSRAALQPFSGAAGLHRLARPPCSA